MHFILRKAKHASTVPSQEGATNRKYYALESFMNIIMVINDSIIMFNDSRA